MDTFCSRPSNKELERWFRSMPVYSPFDRRYVWPTLLSTPPPQFKLLTAGDSIEDAKTAEKTMTTHGAKEDWLKTLSVRAFNPTSRSLCGF